MDRNLLHKSSKSILAAFTRSAKCLLTETACSNADKMLLTDRLNDGIVVQHSIAGFGIFRSSLESVLSTVLNLFHSILLVCSLMES